MEPNTVTYPLSPLGCCVPEVLVLILQSLAVLTIITAGVAWLIGAAKFYRALRIGGIPAREYQRKDDTGIKGLGVGVRLDLLVAAWPIVVALPELRRVRLAEWSAVDPWDGRWPGEEDE